MNKFHMLLQYLRYLLRAKTRHGIHSPFVYSFIEEILRDKIKYADYQIVERQVTRLKQNRNVLEIVDFGTGKAKAKYSTYFKRVQEVAKAAGITRKHGRLLYRMVRHYQPATMLELGTSLGISTMYQAKGNPNAQLTAIEGCASLAMIAQQSLDKTHCNNVTIKTAHFKTILPTLLNDLNKPLNYAFIDGDHSYDGTMQYFEMLKKHIDDNSILVFHDIHWSKGMEKAWSELKQDPQVSISIDLYFMGILFFQKTLNKQDFVLRF